MENKTASDAQQRIFKIGDRVRDVVGGLTGTIVRIMPIATIYPIDVKLDNGGILGYTQGELIKIE
jgi:hypothetical protein